MWQTIKESGREWSEDKVPRLSAALAFYTMLSLAVIVIGAAFERESSGPEQADGSGPGLAEISS